MIDTVIEELAEALLRRDKLHLRSHMQAWLRADPPVTELACPTTRDARVLTAAAALAELLALQLGQEPPDWTKDVGGLPEPFFVMSLGEKPGYAPTFASWQYPPPNPPQ